MPIDKNSTYNSWQETNYLLYNVHNREALNESLNQLSNGKSHVLTPEEFKATKTHK
ncbi:hypothetical protein MOO46_06820 [Apilactobacillus apisilvae]|uniref:Uncharacterized protein n=1 Tax=Apilactobacillus apisilvae TaxID=2923364 RepID=A0ABY4PGP4_9LACO|nr:hypothetical protein [Apilactobacillus apisilvae]UQS84950.1 hypothetical protein MOO46_06820 [Apilactobacillus apisilvae]